MVRRTKLKIRAATWEQERLSLMEWCEQKRQEPRPPFTGRKNEGLVPSKSTLQKRLNLLEPIYHKIA